MISRILPYPVLTLSLIVFWMTINSFSPDISSSEQRWRLLPPWSMASLRPSKPRIRSWTAVIKLIAIVLYDIIRSNISVATLILFGGRETASPAF